MNIRRVLMPAGIAVVALSLGARSFAGDDKQLQSQKGAVSYQAPSGKPVPLAVNATIGLADHDYAITGGASLAQVLLPDSSSVLVGSDTKVQLAFFNQAQIANAKFVVYDGRVRFAVRHPQGAKANYTFQTATGSVGVRGTQGDIEYESDGSLRVNVYELCDPNAPVLVTTKGGKIFKIVAGQSLFAHIVNGIVQTELQQLTQQLVGQFAGDFGIPTSWDAARGEVIGYAGGAVNNVTGGFGSEVISGIGSLFKKKATPSPAPTRSTCS
ncbi:MAG: FecR domain-containing protein [Candidatus Eremiobacteraeota bacterium]|nr:FecR domain-containing protein [Candidatus Eremiobacteraeota bacterium]